MTEIGTEALKIFHIVGDVIEIRVIGKGKLVSCGFFKDADLALKEAMKYDGKSNIYFVLNKIKEACYYRENKDKIIDKIAATSDGDIENREWILIDCDPIRVANISATDEEKQCSQDIMKKVGNYLREKHFSSPVIADSGNGWHLLYKINLPNNKEIDEMIKQFLQFLSMLFTTEKVKVDVAVFNASRVTKLYGVMAVKGSNVPERPHRRSAITFIPKTIQITDIETIRKIVKKLPVPPARTNQSEFDLHEFISKYRIDIVKTATLGDGKKHILRECPFDSVHGEDAAIIELNSGAVAFNCFHDGCANNGWKEFREIYEPYKERKPTSMNDYKQSKKPNIIEPMVNIELDEKTKKILERANDLSDVKKIDRSKMQVLTTGVPTLDKKMELIFGKLVVVSGTNGSGKSTFIGQLMLESLEQNFNVFTYSGELLDNEFQYWIDLQAAGPDHVIKKISQKGKEYFDIKTDAVERIHEWYKNRFFLYKNNESMMFNDILDVVEAFRIHKKCNVIFLDNFLTMDISDLDDKDLKAQTIFINSLANYCKLKNVIIFLVIHPKKIYKGICTKGDVLGSGNLTNAIDYLLIVHLNNEAFKTALKDRVISNTAKASLLLGSNILDVQKDRWTGSEGLNIPLKYYADSKRLIDISSAETSKKYSWDKSEQQAIEKEFWED